MWAIWQQLTDTHIARVFYEDLGQLKTLGLDGIVSCQSFRAFYPSGLAMATLAEALWNPNRPLDTIRQAHIEAAFGPDAAFADDYLRKTEAFLRTGDPHRRALPFSDATVSTLDTCAAFLDASLVALEARQNAAADPVRRLSLALLANHARLLAQIVASHQAQLAGNRDEAERALDDAADLLRRTERRFSPYIDTMLALRLSVDAHRKNLS
jgi:hypothetical protein